MAGLILYAIKIFRTRSGYDGLSIEVPYHLPQAKLESHFRFFAFDRRATFGVFVL